MKKIAIVPTLLTLGNGVCGFAAIALASKVTGHEPDTLTDYHFAAAGWLILFAMLFDMLDGYVARLSRTASAFGGELDSLCDAISFGVAPAFLLLKLGPGWERVFLHQIVAGIAALYLACTVLRLARFNVSNTPDPSGHKRFRGLPSPGAAGCIAALAILRGEFATNLARILGAEFPSSVAPEDLERARTLIVQAIEVAAPVGALLVALLMVSNVPYPHLTGKVFRGRKHVGHLVQVLLAGMILILFRELAPLLVFWVYAFLFPLRALLAGKTLVTESPTPHFDDAARHDPA